MSEDPFELIASLLAEGGVSPDKVVKIIDKIRGTTSQARWQKELARQEDEERFKRLVREGVEHVEDHLDQVVTLLSGLYEGFDDDDEAGDDEAGEDEDEDEEGGDEDEDEEGGDEDEEGGDEDEEGGDEDEEGGDEDEEGGDEDDGDENDEDDDEDDDDEDDDPRP